MEVCVRSRTVGNVVILTALMFALAAPAAAQTRASSSSSSGSGDSTLVGVGLSFLNGGGASGVGVAADVRLPDLKSTDILGLGIVGDVGLNREFGASIITVGGGVRATFKIQSNPKIMPYGQFLIGIEHCCGQTELYFGPGFGLDFAFKDTMNFRGQLDFRHVNTPVVGFNETRFWFGVSFPLGKS